MDWKIFLLLSNRDFLEDFIEEERRIADMRQNWAKVGRSLLYYSTAAKPYNAAREECRKLHSHLVEFATEGEFLQVGVSVIQIGNMYYNSYVDFRSLPPSP